MVKSMPGTARAHGPAPEAAGQTGPRALYSSRVAPLSMIIQYDHTACCACRAALCACSSIAPSSRSIP
eukprot:2223039-Rhodomonas_salina.1